MANASIDGADFSAADLRYANLSGLPLRTARFDGAVFARAYLLGCDMEGMGLPGADFTESRLRGALLTGSRMRGACFTRADLQGAGLAEVDWEEANLYGADLRNCTFHLGTSRSGLVGSPIASEGSRTGFYGDEFDQQTYRRPEEIRKANLCRADLRNARLDGTDFYLVDLRGARYTPEQFEHLRRCGAILFDRAREAGGFGQGAFVRGRELRACAADGKGLPGPRACDSASRGASSWPERPARSPRGPARFDFNALGFVHHGIRRPRVPSAGHAISLEWLQHE